jgi:hypothetical protein
VVVGFHEAFQTTAQLCRKRCVRISSSVTRLMVEAFCHRLSWGMKHESITWNCRQKTVIGMASLNFSLEEEVDGFPLSWKIMATIFGMQKG